MYGCVCLLLTSTLAAPTRLYVAVDGNDAWTGRVALANAAHTEGPVRSLARARDLARALHPLAAPVEIIVGAGTHYLTEPLILTPEDSGTEACPVTWRAADGAKPVISGGRAVTGWQAAGDGLWSAPAGDLKPRLLRAGESWATRARWPLAEPGVTGGWRFAKWGGEPWEKGLFGQGVSNTHNVGAALTWTVRVPADGTYRVWLRYGHKMGDYGTKDMGGRTAITVDDGPDVKLERLPDTGDWAPSAWANTAELTLTAGEHRLKWTNRVGGGINLDALALCDDPAWDPAVAMGKIEWWGACEVKPPAAGRHLLMIQCEACDKAEGAEISVPKPTPPGQFTHLTFGAGDLPHFADTAGAEAHVFIAWGWVNAIVPIDNVDWDQRRLVFTGTGAAQDVRMGNRYFVENVREGLAGPNTWYLDQAAGRLLYRPDQGADKPPAPMVAAVLDRVIDIKGDPAADKWVEHVHLRGLAVRDTGYTLTTDYYTPSDAAVHIAGARHMSLTDCDLAWVGGYGVQLADRANDVEVSRCRIQDVGQGGVHLVGGTAVQPHHNRILANEIERIGLIYKHVAGVYLTHGSDNRIAHNRIWHTPRYGISFKSQGEDRLSHRNVIEYNDLRYTNQETNDTGAVESLGYEHRDSGNIVRYNLIRDVIGLATSTEGEFLTPYFNWGIYLDDYSSGTIIYGNIVARTYNGGVCVHGGQNNRIENNILVDAREHQVRLQPRDDFMKGNTFVGNIVLYHRPEAQLIFQWNDRTDTFAEWDRNVYWLVGADLTAREGNVTPVGPYAKWRAAGKDATSVVADPLFVDAEHDDYRLKPDSPALRLGFKPIPVDKIGPRGMD
ncbi:MAG: right-handed parallel beta-helix repeat-containing protein [Armatimonadetes bacterium]|nr:right-handed parallel beta-helix repeat-containing protein [Armatimonadota bacterium]